MRCGQISNADIKGFETQMINDGLSDSSIQKEVALLKVFFNSVGTFNWKGVDNPCIGIKLGKSQRRFVHLTAAQKMALTQALLECDNPYFMPLALTAKESTLRLDTLVNMTWSNTSVEERIAYLPTKTGMRPYTLSKEVQAILAGLPQPQDGKIFPMSKSAIDSMWERVRQKCGLPTLQFRDLRHLGATDWVRRGLTAHQLKQVLGHDSIATAQFYVDLVGKDLEEALDKASGNAGVMVMPAGFPKDPQAYLNQRRAERLNKSKVQAQPVDSAPESTPLPVQESSNEPPQDNMEFGTTVSLQPSRKVVSLDAFRRKAA
jgi:integrase